MLIEYSVGNQAFFSEFYQLPSLAVLSSLCKYGTVVFLLNAFTCCKEGHCEEGDDGVV